MNDEYSSMAANAICHSAYAIKDRWLEAISEYDRPSTIFKPRLFIDGNLWCALYGINIQEGLAAFGNSPYEAMVEFDKAWYMKLHSGDTTIAK